MRVWVCVCVCMCVYAYACNDACVCMCKCIHMCVCVPVVSVWPCVCVYVRACVLTFQILYPSRNRSLAYVTIHWLICFSLTFFTMHCHPRLLKKNTGLFSTLFLYGSLQVTINWRTVPLQNADYSSITGTKTRRKIHWDTCMCMTIKNKEN